MTRDSTTALVILLSDSDDDENENESIHQHQKNDPIHMRVDEEATIHSYMEIINCSDVKRALQELEKVDFDLSRALANAFPDQHNFNSDVQSRSSCCVSELTHSVTNGDICNEQRYSKGNCLDLQKETPPSLSTGKEPHLEGALHTQSISRIFVHKPSSKWQEIMDRCSNSGTLFHDSEFPPNVSSLDGRKSRAVLKESAANTYDANVKDGKLKCTCGLNAASKTVQSDGPNYGRMFFACGQPTIPRWKQKTQGEVKLKKCNFFQWDNTGQGGHVSWAKRLSWSRFESKQGCSLVRISSITRNKRNDNFVSFEPAHVRQGAMGNCWFLSALAVVAEKSFLIRRLIPHTDLNDIGCYEIQLCLDGQWTGILIDSFLPVVTVKDQESQNTSTSSSLHKAKEKEDLRGSIRRPIDGAMVQPAFAAAPGLQLWPAMVEKAYAKAHGSYAALSGGYIVEALFDLTGAPTECVHLNGILAIHDHDELWARMLSFSDAGFLMGLATSGGGEGLVSCHAYSVLEVLEVHDSVVGEQPKMTSFFQTAKRQKLSTESQFHKESNDEDDDEVIVVDGPQARHGPCSRGKGERETIRLVRIRNPWGKKEWTGGWSASSEKWTRSSRSKLDGKSYAKGDGTFFMSFQDMLQRFSTLDVAKCHEGWVHKSYENTFLASSRSCGRSISESSSGVLFVRVVERTWAFVSIVQPKKRANTLTQYWYSDASLIVLKRPIHPGDEEWVSHAIILHGVRRTCTCEVFLDPLFEYCIIPFSLLPNVMGNSQAKNATRTGIHSDTIGHSFRLTTYSSNDISIHEKTSKAVSDVAFPTIKCLHRELITTDKKILYVLGPECILLATQGSGCIYFMLLNATYDKRLLLKLTVAPGSKGSLVAFGNRDDTHDLGPRMQRIVLVLMNNGREGHSTNELGFSYASDFVPAPVPIDHRKLQSNAIRLGDPIDLSMAGDVLAAGMDTGDVARMGKGTIDSCLWSSSTA